MSFPSFEDAFGPSESGHWFIEKFDDEAALRGAPLSDWERKALVTAVWEFSDDDRPALFALHNRLVELGRNRIERDKALGVPTKRVRRGLRIPKDWDENYRCIVGGNLDWFVSGVVQSVVLKNELAGEQKRWKSR